MGLYQRRIMPVLIAWACASKSIGLQRKKVVPLAAGDVLELGMGAGANFPYYDRERVSSIRAIEPNAELRRRAHQAARGAEIPVDLQYGIGEDLPFDRGSFDCIVCTYTLCTVADVPATLAEAKRVLKPGGRILFCEHGLAPGEGVARWQRRLEPIWKPIGAGCHLTRQAGASIRQAGFEVEWQEQSYLPNTLRLMGWTEWGVAHL